MNAIITVVGSDKVGIIAKVSTYLSEHKINILDITQTILSGNFVMMMMVELKDADIAIDELRTQMEKTATDMGVDINIFHATNMRMRNMNTSSNLCICSIFCI